jgi:hypothetical protein
VRISASADLGGTLHIDVHDNVAALGKLSDDFLAQCAVEIPVYGGVFEKLTRRDFLLKIFGAEEKVIVAVNFTRTCRTRGARC